MKARNKMEISRIAKGDWGKVKAFFDLTTVEGITIKGFKLVEGVNGLFVGCPSEKDQSGAYKDKVWMDKELKNELRDMAKNAYENGLDVPVKISKEQTDAEYEELNSIQSDEILPF